MAQKYIIQEGGLLKEKEAIVTSSGASNDGAVIALDSTGKLDQSVLPPGIGADTAEIEAGEDLSAGDIVNVYDDAGTPKVRKADATSSGKEAHGFVLEAVTSGSNATVYFEGTNNQLSSLTAGVLFLSTTAGATTSTAPSGSGNVVQRLGVANSATAMNFEATQPIVLA
jgi:hypothetical protein